MNSDERKNWNWDIHIRDIHPQDYYDGLMVQSFGNSECIYEIRLINNRWSYTAKWLIIDREQFKLNSKLEKCNPHTWGTSYWHPIQKEKFSETIYSKSCNISLIREEKLLQLGIE